MSMWGVRRGLKTVPASPLTQMGEEREQPKGPHLVALYGHNATPLRISSFTNCCGAIEHNNEPVHFPSFQVFLTMHLEPPKSHASMGTIFVDQMRKYYWGSSNVR